MRIRTANREDAVQTASGLIFQKQSDLALHCLSWPFNRQLVLEILDYSKICRKPPLKQKTKIVF